MSGADRVQVTREALHAAVKAYREKVEWIDRHSRDDYGREAELAMRAALQAAAPHLKAFPMGMTQDEWERYVKSYR